jgi:DNA-binding transcriptional MerR regulator
VTRAQTDRSHLSIGEVLSLLREEFPDVTISKIRFLESQGLLDPERTPSGYRKFYEADIDRLRWILRQQREHYLPLKVIKDRLDDELARPPSSAAVKNGASVTSAQGGVGLGSNHEAPATAVALEDRPAAAPASYPAFSEAPAPGPGTASAPARSTPRQPVAGAAPPAAAEARNSTGRTDAHAPAQPTERTVPAAPAAPRPPTAPGAVSLTVDELAQHSGLTVRDIRDLERFGLIESFAVGDATYYDGDALAVAQTAAGFLQHGIEARHMRTYKVAIDREAGLFEQIVLPLLKQRNPEARQRARETITELVRLGQQMRAVLLSRELRDVAGHA